jgi:hypothetical protein
VLRHHIQVESKGIFAVIENDLSEWERVELGEQIKKRLKVK